MDTHTESKVENNDNFQNNHDSKSASAFKKPILIGKIGRLPKKILHENSTNKVETTENTDSVDDKHSIKEDSFPASQEETEGTNKQTELMLPYKEPTWSGLPKSMGKEYTFQVLKDGSIIERINLMNQTYWVFGRLASCDIYMQHPTISRYHAVLQYRQEGTERDPPGFYIYDLGSTHGTYLNKNRLKNKVYVRIQVGHMLKLGCSTRSYILTGPDYDEEEESELSVTELKQKRTEELRKIEEEELKKQREIEERKKKEQELGVDWGLGEDAEEETDLSENPYAQTNNEELYIEDPKKALRGFFEREGFELDYNCNEHGIGQFLCKVELPVDDEMGRPIVAEVIHKGKKKEAVVQCALEACRILDRHGVLRQAIHESRKRKVKNWEENDYYDSDDDTFLDRTGTIEKKREKRMNAKIPQKAETYDSLLEKEKSIASSIAQLEKQLTVLYPKSDKNALDNNDEDSLDTYMKELKESKPDKESLGKLKIELTKLKAEHLNIIRLVNIAKPASLPALTPQYAATPGTSKEEKVTRLPIIGKIKKIKVQLPSRSGELLNNDSDDEVEETKEINILENQNNSSSPMEVNSEEHLSSLITEQNENSIEHGGVGSNISSASVSSDEDTSEVTTTKSLNNTMTFKKFENILKKGLSPFASERDKHQDKLEKILNNLKKLATNEDRMHVDEKILAAKKRKVMKLISDLKHYEPNEKLEHRVSSELNRILHELNIMNEQKYKVIDKVKKMGDEIKRIYKEDVETESREESRNTSTENLSIEECTDNEDKKKKKIEKKTQQRLEKAELERQRGYEEDSSRENYSMWVPPNNQTGDGRTALNDKYGY